MRPAIIGCTFVCLASLAGCAGPGDSGNEMSGMERQALADSMTRMDPMVTGQIPAADGDNMMQ